MLNMDSTILCTITLVGLLSLQGVVNIQQPACDHSSCYPATGDLLIGRENMLTAESTCGLERPERYCIVSHLEDEKKCFVCDSTQPYVQGLNNMSHKIENIVSSFLEDRKERWWQAENGKESVWIQLDLEAEFHFTHLIMRFKTFRPAAMFIERSYDFGKTWKIYRYFAYDCDSAFPRIPKGPIRNINDIICESRYSDVAPSSGGEVIFRVLPPNIVIEDPYSEEVQDLLKMTNLRVVFTKLHTLGDDLLDSRDEIKEKYYYSLYDMVIRGSCSCYGHASRCKPVEGQIPQTNMVYGECECTHNTVGRNCEKCAPFYNDLPWRPARERQTNQCKKCECNMHATRCHFDPAVYELTGRTSGGVCDDCQHNTMGRNCEECMPSFYRDPAKRISDFDVCKPCECSRMGSEHDGECTSYDEPSQGLRAGTCICKAYVEGQYCDTCMNGYWNLAEENPFGCDPCTCNTVGTINNFGCDKWTGDCQCKRFVTGRDCDQCLPQYWGLSEDIEGCKECGCDIGGAYDNDCDQFTGQCSCRPHIRGRQCNEAEPGYFVPNLDFYVYEGEEGYGIGNTREVFREPVVDRPPTWTGPGFMRVNEGDSLEFTIDNLPISMEYDIVIRYEPQMPERWDDVRVSVIRPNDIDQQGVCANTIPQDDHKASSLPQDQRWSLYGDGFGNIVQEVKAREVEYEEGQRFIVVPPSSCLEAGKSYIIRLDFNRYRSDRVTPEASVLIDSITLVPNIDGPPIFEGGHIPDYMQEEFRRYQCREQQLPVVKSPMNDVCKDYIFSITALMEDQALDCKCDPTGSYSTICDPQGGTCQCKPNVIGRQCDQCAPGFYGFGPEGCLACDCDLTGSYDNFCNPTTGQCFCLPGVYGRRCNECSKGMWGFPRCQPCQCNGRATECENETGFCIECQDNTGGASCDRCADGYYGDAWPGSTIGCRECMCPGGIESGYQHGQSCHLDTRNDQVICDCDTGYTGVRCDRCAENYYGNPLVVDGGCQACTCNNNIDMNIPGSCDATTGQCLRCMYNTEGFNCERCAPGYYGDATQQSCFECICNVLGTDASAGPCDIVTGQCPCLPNVVGQNCDRCAPNHWKIALGEGCEACACDPEGSVSAACNEFDGQCECLPGRGGRTCSECEALHWGDPNDQCFRCECNIDGSETMQCDRRTGKCECVDGVAGHLCDHCDRGTTGELPYCVPCGECFDNWDEVIQQLHNETDTLVNKGSNIKIGGAPGAFRKEFEEMERKLDEVQRILAGANVTESDLDELDRQLQVIRNNVSQSMNFLDETDGELQDTVNRIETSNNRIDAIHQRIDALKKSADDLKKNATSIRELDVGGAFNSTKESERRSAAAAGKVAATEDTVRQSENYRLQVEELISNNKDRFDSFYLDNEQGIRDIDTSLNRLDDKIVDLNEMVCDGRGDPCDLLCGGAGCNSCGGTSCGDGAITKASNALEFAKQADMTLKEKYKMAADLLRDVRAAQVTANMAKEDAQMAYDSAMEAKNESESNRALLEDLINRISDFLAEQDETARPADIRLVSEETFAMSISLTPDEIENLATQIRETIQGLTDIDAILDATKDDLNTARSLKQRADYAKTEAEDILNTAGRVLEALEDADIAQSNANAAIEQADQDIRDASADLEQIEAEAAEARSQSSATLQKVDDLKQRTDTLKRTFLENEANVNKAEEEARIAEEKANEAEQDAMELENKYNQVVTKLDMKYNETRTAKIRADALRDRASHLYQETYEKIERLRAMDQDFLEKEKSLEDLSGEIAELNRRMEDYLTAILNVAKFHRTCNS